MNLDLVLIDTSVWLRVLGKSSQANVRKRVGALLEEQRVAITPMVTLELLGGTRTDDEFSRLKDRLGALHQIPIGEEEWGYAARLAFNLRRQGKTIPYTDILIATAAISFEAILLHADHHFIMMAESTPLSQENILLQ